MRLRLTKETERLLKQHRSLLKRVDRYLGSLTELANQLIQRGARKK